MVNDIHLDEPRLDVLSEMRAGTRAWLQEPVQARVLDRIALLLLNGCLPEEASLRKSVSQLLAVSDPPSYEGYYDGRPGRVDPISAALTQHLARLAKLSPEPPTPDGESQQSRQPEEEMQSPPGN